MFNIISKLIGLKVTNTEYGSLVTFPIWLSSKNREKVLEQIKLDYETVNNKTMRTKMGVRNARLEFER